MLWLQRSLYNTEKTPLTENTEKIAQENSDCFLIYDFAFYIDTVEIYFVYTLFSSFCLYHVFTFFTYNIDIHCYIHSLTHITWDKWECLAVFTQILLFHCFEQKLNENFHVLSSQHMICRKNFIFSWFAAFILVRREKVSGRWIVKRCVCLMSRKILLLQEHIVRSS